MLRYLLESPGEIAELLELPRGTVNSRLRRGLDALEERRRERQGPPPSSARPRFPASTSPAAAVQVSFVERGPRIRERKVRWKRPLAAALLLAAVAVGVSPVGSEIGGWIRDTVGRGRVVGVTPARPELASLPRPDGGRSPRPRGVWLFAGMARGVAHGRGTWSPNGLLSPSGRAVSWPRSIPRGPTPSTAGAQPAADRRRALVLSGSALRTGVAGALRRGSCGPSSDRSSRCPGHARLETGCGARLRGGERPRRRGRDGHARPPLANASACRTGRARLDGSAGARGARPHGASRVRRRGSPAPAATPGRRGRRAGPPRRRAATSSRSPPSRTRVETAPSGSTTSALPTRGIGRLVHFAIRHLVSDGRVVLVGGPPPTSGSFRFKATGGSSRWDR